MCLKEWNNSTTSPPISTTPSPTTLTPSNETTSLAPNSTMDEEEIAPPVDDSPTTGALRTGNESWPGGGGDAHCIPPHSFIDNDTILDLWRVVYWTSQLLTWIVLPLMQSFSQAGEFTFLGKLRSSLWDNAIYYTSYLLIAIILIIYIALQP